RPLANRRDHPGGPRPPPSRTRTPHLTEDVITQGRDPLRGKAQCGDAFCTIQEGTPGRYHIWRFSGCGRFTLENFKGEWDTHNHGSLTVNFRNQQREIIARYAGGRSTNVIWDPYWHVSTCNR
ncbi:hypothetical protein, partial [Nonomuraea sp. B5E05]|uniref:hypothetical protein n=1 Tax=Nonomuraea sp. B5E05 TaxID=3153569 RepID=UPI0032609A9B